MKKHESEKWNNYGSVRLLTRNRLLFPWHRMTTQVFLDLFASVNVNSKVLDIGCGDGFWLELLRSLGFSNLLGIDLSKPMLERCLSKNLNAAYKDVYDLDYNSEFDVIIMGDVLEHLSDVHKALLLVYKALAMNGILYITIPTCDSFAKRFYRLIHGVTKIDQLQTWDETHIQAWSAKDLKNILEKAGFTVKWIRHTYNPFPIIGRFNQKLYNSLCKFTFGGRFGDIVSIYSVKGIE